MIYFSLLLHIYQPPTQDLNLTKKITNNSYKLILKIVEQTKSKTTLNIPASLTEQLIINHNEDVVRGITELQKKGLIEFTGTGAFHPILPKLPKEQIIRQIQLNDVINKKYFGAKIYCPDGFFPPEMAYSTKVDRVLNGLGYQWVILDELCYAREKNTLNHQVIYVKEDKNNINENNKKISKSEKNNLKYFFRDDELSLSVAMSRVNSISGFKRILNEKKRIANSQQPTANSYYILAMDGETFGHHQAGQDKLLLDILRCDKYQFVHISELGKYIRTKELISALPGSWALARNDLRKKTYYPKWSFPGNKIHKLQWRLFNLALTNSLKTNDDRQSSILDKALHSDQFWWASESSDWHPEMVEKGAAMLRDAIYENPANNDIVKKEAEKLYSDIVRKLQITNYKLLITN